VGAAGGLATLALISLIHQSLTEPATDSLRLPALFACACAFVLATQVFSKCVQVRLSNSTAARLRYELSGRIMTAPLPRLEAVGAHRLIASLGADVDRITVALTGFPGVCADVAVLICGMGYLASLSLPVAGCVILVAGIGVVNHLIGLRIARRYLIQAREDQDEVVGQTRAMVHGIKELKGNRSRCLDFFYGVLLPADTKMRKNVIVGASIEGFAHSWGRLFLLLGLGMLLFVWPRWYPVSAATLTGYTLTILYLTHPLGGILGWLPAINSASIALAKINRLGLSLDDSEEQTLPIVIPPFESLEMRGVTYGYESSDGRGFSLGPIDLKVTAGEELFIAGGNGSGKTTLAKILTGLYVPNDGQVVLNGEVVSDAIRGNYRQLFSTVFVEGHVFDRLLGIDLDQARIRHFARLLGIEKYIDLETGHFCADKLSRGQHKRMALLVACMDDRPILIFDEWAAEQDPGFKDTFYREILPELRKQGKTVVAITHDDRYFSAADRVLTIVDGQLDRTAAKIAA
jgi:putative ATP-binding cassette transporter